MKRILTHLLDRICGQPDLLRKSRNLALKQLLELTEPAREEAQ